MGKKSEEQRGWDGETVEIASVLFFGRWRVQVFRLAYTQADQENTRTGIPADNWRELEPEASALMLAAFGTIATKSQGLQCPAPLARRARWHIWQARHRGPVPEGK